MIFKTHDLADAYVESVILQELPFCPLIKTQCNQFCINFIKPDIIENEDDTFEIKKPDCSNPLITGEIEISTGAHTVSIEDIHR